MRRWWCTPHLTVLALLLLAGGGALVSQTTRAAVPYAVGDVLASVGRGQVKHFSPTGTLLETLDTTTGSTFTAGGCFDAAGNFYVTDFSTNQVSKFTNQGTLVTASFGSGFNASPESCTLDAAGHLYVGQATGSGHILQFNPSGTLLSAFAAAPENKGSDWISLAADQCTLLYTSEGPSLKAFNVCTNAQLPSFAMGLPSPCFANRIRLNGEVLVACSTAVVRLSAAGTLIQMYPANSLAPTETSLFALNLDPDGTTFWTGGDLTGTVYRVNIASGVVVTTFNAGPITELDGLSIFGEQIVSQPTPTPTPTATPTRCILGDINCDGIVDIRDYGIWRQNFGQTNCGNPADLNNDCIVDIRDYGVWRQNFGHTAGAAARTATPTAAPRGAVGPAGMATRQAEGAAPAVPIVPLVGGLLGLGGLAGWRRRRPPSQE
jgi:MYXO-CTERM domain-containing protein